MDFGASQEIKNEVRVNFKLTIPEEVAKKPFFQKESFTKEILARIKSLGKREIREVMVFIDFLQEKKEAEPFICYIKEKADRKITLAQVRQELSSIKGSLSETISKQREERG